MTVVNLPVDETLVAGDALPAAEVLTMAQIINAIAPIGKLVDFYGLESQVPNGLLPCNGGTIGDASSSATARANADMAALFAHLWTIGNTNAGSLMIYTSAGAISTFGANAAADFAAHKRIALPDLRGRTLAHYGTGSKAWVISNVNTGTDVLTIPSNTSLYTGQAVVFSSNGGTDPTGLTSATTYYVIRTSATTIKLATSAANAIAGTAVDVTTSGSGTLTVTKTLTARAMGDVSGEEAHTSLTAETPAHTHSGGTLFYPNGGGSGSNFHLEGGVAGTPQTITTGSAGGDGEHNNMQPTLYVSIAIWTGATW